MTEVKSSKLSTRQGTLLAELVPTPKIIAELRGWYPKARLVGWKFEVDGDRAGVIALAERQLADCRTDACVTNGAAYGNGFGLVTGAGKCLHLADATVLFPALEKIYPKMTRVDLAVAKTQNSSSGAIRASSAPSRRQMRAGGRRRRSQPAAIRPASGRSFRRAKGPA